MNLTRSKSFFAIACLAGGGTLFAGYLTFFNAFTGKCALGEACPYVLGLPACVYGFVVFLALTAVAKLAWWRKVAASWPEQVLVYLSGFGILFAGTLTATEVAGWLASGRSYALVLPTCFYGLVFYVAVFVLAMRLQQQKDA